MKPVPPIMAKSTTASAAAVRLFSNRSPAQYMTPGKASVSSRLESTSALGRVVPSGTITAARKSIAKA